MPTEAVASPGVADHLAFTLQPASGTVDDSLHVTVEVQDDGNALVSASTDQISLSLNSGSFDAGTTTLGATGGVADFTGLEIHTPGTYTITATDDTTSGVSGTSTGFTLTAGAPAQLAFGSQPSDTLSARPSDPSTADWVVDFTVEVLDTYGNLVDDNTDHIQVTLNTGSFSDGNDTRAAVGGIATFDDLKVLAPGTYTITASDTDDAGVSDATSAEFDILPHADLQLTMSSSGNDVAGLDQTYTVHVANFGPNANVSYTVTANLPTDITALGTGSGTGCSLSSGVVTCTRSGGIPGRRL